MIIVPSGLPQTKLLNIYNTWDAHGMNTSPGQPAALTTQQSLYWCRTETLSLAHIHAKTAPVCNWTGTEY